MLLSVPNGGWVQVRVKVFGGNWLWMNLGWYRTGRSPKIVIDQLVVGVYFVANG
jgi:hypothetical protein